MSEDEKSKAIQEKIDEAAQFHERWSRYEAMGERIENLEARLAAAEAEISLLKQRLADKETP
jgi:hypothetical protein